jgi:hypothetical protein
MDAETADFEKACFLCDLCVLLSCSGNLKITAGKRIIHNLPKKKCQKQS